MKICEAGKNLKKVGYYLSDLMQKGYLLDDIFSSSKIMTAAADDRMAGVSLPVISSGGSGNQGIVAILVPYNLGKCFKFEEKRINQSISLSHLMNSYVKSFTGGLSAVCYCAILAGVGAPCVKSIEVISILEQNLLQRPTEYDSNNLWNLSWPPENQKSKSCRKKI